MLTLWIAASFAHFRERSVEELWTNQGFDAQVKFQIASWLAFGVIALRLIATRRVDLQLVRHGPFFWYCCFVFVALLSTLYSVSPALTLFRSLQLAVAIILVISLREQLSNVYYLIAAYIAVNWILFLIGWFGIDAGAAWIRGPDDLYVSYGGTRFEAWRFWTAFGHPSQISIVAGIAAVGLTARTRGRQWLPHGPLIACLVLTVVLTVSRTAMLATLVGFLIVAAGRRALLPWIAAGSALLFVLLASPDFQDMLTRYLQRGQTTQEFASLTGRVRIYQAALDRIEGSWVLGDGFRATRKQLLGSLDIVHSHNLVLEALASLGLPGAVLCCIVLISLVTATWTVVQNRRRSNLPDDHTLSELPALVILIVAFCVMDSGFAVEVDPFILVFLAILAMVQTELLRPDHRGNVPATTSRPGGDGDRLSAELLG